MNDIAVTLFSGMGSSSKAARDLGLEVYPHDFNADAVATLQANGFTNARRCDVRNIDYSAFEGMNVRLLAGGPPCQPFSQSHQGKGRYDEKDMIPEFLRAVAELLPEVFVMEEVQTLTWAKHADYLAMVEDHMRTLGYEVEHRVLNAAEYGIPQARKRLFVVGRRLDIAANDWNIDTNTGVFWPEKQRQQISLADALGWDRFEATKRNKQVPDPRAHIDGALVNWPYQRPGMTVVGSFRPEVMAAPGYRVKGDPPRQATPGSVVLTLEERLVLQDMPTDWVLVGNEASKALQVGNSVPCGLIRSIYKENLR